MTDRSALLAQIAARLGDDATSELTEAMFYVLDRAGWIRFRPSDGFRIESPASVDAQEYAWSQLRHRAESLLKLNPYEEEMAKPFHAHDVVGDPGIFSFIATVIGPIIVVALGLLALAAPVLGLWGLIRAIRWMWETPFGGG